MRWTDDCTANLHSFPEIHWTTYDKYTRVVKWMEANVTWTILGVLDRLLPCPYQQDVLDILRPDHPRLHLIFVGRGCDWALCHYVKVALRPRCAEQLAVLMCSSWLEAAAGHPTRGLTALKGPFARWVNVVNEGTPAETHDRQWRHLRSTEVLTGRPSWKLRRQTLRREMSMKKTHQSSRTV